MRLERTATFASASRSHDLSRTSAYTLLAQRFGEAALDLPYVQGVNGWAEGGVSDMIEAFVKPFTTSRAQVGHGFRAWLATDKETACLVELENEGNWTLTVAGKRPERVEALVAQLTKALPQTANLSEDSITVRFWANSPMGPLSYSRRLDAAPWAGVETNYPSGIGKELGALMRMQQPPASGRLMLWHGPAGTGKTHAIRALAQGWREWCDVDYVVDADEFFEHAAYMVGTLVMNEDPGTDRWRLVVIEDSGEFLRADASTRVGQGLSRLLNLTDGLVGQGLRLLTLMTTNEPADELHPAVTRPGRCLANMHFGPFEADEAAGWLAAQGLEAKLENGATLAELYAMSKSLRVDAARRKVDGLRRSTSKKG